MTLKQRAARVWASQGQPVAMIESMTAAEIDRLAGLVDENGRQVADFRQEFLQFHADYFDARKAAADEPTVIEDEP